MAERVPKATVSGWRPWAIGAAALSMGCAVLLFFRRQRSASRPAPDDYEAWWQHRAHVRANGTQPSPGGDGHAENPQLFV
jgi:hypothetical protein